MAEWLNSLGFSAFVIKYRVPAKEHPEIDRMDMERAVSTVRFKALEYNIDADKIGVIGFSAGGDLCTWVSSGTSQRSYPRIDEIDDVPFRANFQLLIYAVVPPLQDFQYPAPTFIAHAADDPCVSPANSELYCAQVISRGQNCTLHLYPNGGHGIGVCTGYWKDGVPHVPSDRGFDDADGWYNTWSGDSFCQWMDAAESWLLDMV